MIIIPAIDIQGGKVVRLNQGKFDQTTHYADDPLAFAKKWADAGAQRIHVVDLDGAQTGQIVNQDVIIKIARSVNIPVEMGGGIRTLDDISTLISGGVRWVILGTKIVEEKNFLKEALKRWPGQIMVSVDCSDGIVTQKGWTVKSDLKGTDFAGELEKLGLKTLIYTDIARDGMLSGPNIPRIKEILDAVRIPVIASGGVSTLKDLTALKALGSEKLLGVIIGKALYENKFTLSEAIKTCS